MDATRPLGSGDNLFRKSQLALLNVEYNGLPRSYAVEHIHSISNLAKKNDTTSRVWASVYAFVFPAYLGASIIQLFFVTLSDTTNMLLNHPRKEYVVINPNTPEETSELRNVSPLEGVKELARHIAAIIPTLICWAPSIAAPGIYYREDLKPFPATNEAQTHSLTTHEKGAIEVERDRLLEANKTAKLDAFFEMFQSAITPKNYEQVSAALLALEIDGVALSQVSEEDADVYVQASWGPTGKKLFTARDPYVEVELSNKEQFLKPIGTIELEIDCTKIKPEYVARILGMPHDIHRLVLKNPDMRVFQGLEASGVLSKIHTLAIRDKNGLQVAVLEQIADAFKTIACFDIQGCRLDGELSRSFIDGHIVRASIIERSSRGEQSATSFLSEFDNIQDQFNHLNREMLYRTIMTGFTREEVLNLAKHFPVADENKLFHPAAPFITKLCFFRETEVSSKQLKNLMPRLKRTFPHLRVLDLSGCKLLDSEALVYLEQYPVRSLYLDRCEGIFFRQLSSTDSYTMDHRLVLDQNRRNYLVNIEYVTNRFIKLFSLGTKVIRVLEMDCLRATNSNIRKGSPPEYYAQVRAYLEQCLFPEMDQMLSPPDERHVYIAIADFQYGQR
ncbi:MAG: hypothetical protein KFB93_05955 [Simkaniaceae bacterium]|nr:MAG: hypothetical protein KFB93_05955 [Simkaniaceae bacterium]